MQEKQVLQFKTVLKRETFLWVTKKRQVLRLGQMKTSHIFNSMKLLYNHLAKEYGMPTFWFRQQYQDVLFTIHSLINNVCKLSTIQMNTHRFTAEIIVLFIMEIEARGDLPDKYCDVYNKIIAVLRNASKIESILLEDTHGKDNE